MGSLFYNARLVVYLVCVFVTYKRPQGIGARDIQIMRSYKIDFNHRNKCNSQTSANDTFLVDCGIRFYTLV